MKQGGLGSTQQITVQNKKIATQAALCFYWVCHAVSKKQIGKKKRKEKNVDSLEAFQHQICTIKNSPRT